MVVQNSPNRVGGIVFIKVDGKQLRCRGKWTVHDGGAKLEGVVGNDGVHGYKETPQQAYIEGEITVTPDLDVAALKAIRDATVTAEYGAQKVGVLRNAWFAGDGVQDLEEGSMTVRFEGLSYEQVK